jgi:hypothetical protein
MMAAEGTTQALRRTIDASLQLRGASAPTILSIPDAYGALILKAAAHMTISGIPAHLRDAVILLTCLRILQRRGTTRIPERCTAGQASREGARRRRQRSLARRGRSGPCGLTSRPRDPVRDRRTAQFG